MVTEGYECVYNRGIKYIDDETLVDTNDKTNPTWSNITIMYPNDTEVWSLFLRNDGNPLLHAFKMNLVGILRRNMIKICLPRK